MEAAEQNVVSSRILTIPNLLSFIRLALVPVFLVFLIVRALERRNHGITGEVVAW